MPQAMTNEIKGVKMYVGISMIMVRRFDLIRFFCWQVRL